LASLHLCYICRCSSGDISFIRLFGQVLVDVAYLLGFLRFVNIQLSSRWPKVEIAQATQPREFAAMIPKFTF
jgi:hypothetical protein